MLRKFDILAFMALHGRMKTLFSVIFLIVLSGTAFAGPNGNCTCRHKGGDVIEGQTACIRTSKGMMLAVCDRVLNNTSWKMLDQPCPTAGLISPEKFDNSESVPSESRKQSADAEHS